MDTRMRWLLGLVVLAAACAEKPAAHGPATEVVAAHRGTVPKDPAAAEWKDAPEFVAALQLQDMVEPRLLVPSTKEVRVRALSDGVTIAFRLEWADGTQNDVPGVSKFSDACAVQLPAAIQPDVPAPQMGEGGRAVEISYWRAFWQSTVDGRPDTINALYPRAAIDHYPFEAAPLKPGSPEQQAAAKRYAPARALDNAMAGPRERPVEDLVAEGPGTIHPGKPVSDGRGRRSEGGWTIVLARPLPDGLKPDARTQVAFAVWDGAHEEGGARKMRSAWVPLLLEGAK